jgi:hypothetical protein
MDFLSRNTDRHPGNLLVNDQGKLLAIDHGRSFQYEGQTIGDRANVFGMYRPKLDSLQGVASHGATSRFAPGRVQRGRNDADWYDKVDRHRDDWQQTLDWWGGSSDKVKSAFHQSLEQIKDPDVKDHLRRNFNARARYLDERAEFGLDNFGQMDWGTDEAPLYKPGELSEDEQRDPDIVAEYSRRAEARRQAQVQARADSRTERQKAKAHEAWRKEQPWDRTKFPNEEVRAQAWKEWEARKP